jgi:hypothetical protein
MPRKKVLVSNPTIGADIEVFLRDKDTNEIVSAEGIIRGSKDVPFKFKDGNPFFATSLDNVMAEFCIPPVTNGKDFHNNIQEALGYINSTIPNNLVCYAYPSAYINEKYLQTENALLFGCEPDANAWKWGEMNPKPNTADAITLRSCGGHIHVGYKKPNFNTTIALMRAMDIYIGLPSILQEPDNERKRLYGKAGAFRIKTYGGEYRTISNYYINSPSLTEWAFENTMCAIEFVNKESGLDGKECEAIQAAINLNDSKLASTMCTYFGVKLAA